MLDIQRSIFDLQEHIYAPGYLICGLIYRWIYFSWCHWTHFWSKVPQKV